MEKKGRGRRLCLPLIIMYSPDFLIPCPGSKNYAVAVKEWNDEIIFVRQVMPGASERSFGIQVARLAGLPNGVVTRAKQILANLEEGDQTSSEEFLKVSDQPSKDSVKADSALAVEKPQPKRRVAPRVDPSQLELF